MGRPKPSTPTDGSAQRGLSLAEPAHRVPGNPIRALSSAALWSACAHLATDSVASLAGLGVLLLLVVGVCLMPLGLVGLPVVVLAGRAVNALAGVERRRFAATCGLDIPPPRRPALSRSPYRSAVALVTSVPTWRQLGYFLVLAPVACLTSVGVTVLWAVPLALALLPAYYARLPSGSAVLGPLTVGSLPSALAVAALTTLVGAVVSPLLVRALIALDIALGRALLSAPRASQLAERVERLTESRARAVDAAEAERRRIERDLHDGAQQRLVAISMTLGRASARLRGSTDKEAVELVEDARRETLQAIAELRSLARGLHPPVLTDRGLDAALSAVAARSPIPVALDVVVEPRPPVTTEAIAYFVVSEALTNVAKHAKASRAWVVIRRVGEKLTITIGDDGIGGAHPRCGGGLAGLADRLAGIDGELRVNSPAGGPTHIEVSMQCGS